MNNKCLNCTDRYPACQDLCPHGIKLKQANAERKQKIQKAKAKDKLNRDYIYEHYKGGKTF